MRDWGQWRDDLLAGLVGAVAGAPQAMGFALIAGVNPVYGLYTAVISTIFGAALGSSTYMTVGPTNALALVVASTLSDLNGGNQVELVFVLTLLTGAFFLLFAVLRLGFLVRFVSNAVMTGFITGAGLLIVFGQVRHLNGYDPSGSNALLSFLDWVVHLHRSNPQTVVIAGGAIAVMLLLQRTRLQNLATLIAIVAASVATLLLNWEAVALVRDIADVPRGLPTPTLPDLAAVPDLATAAFALAVLGAVQSAAIANVAPGPEGRKPIFGRDLIGMGVGNIVGALFQSIPACGSLSRTAINVAAGARTRWANAIAGGFVALMLLMLGAAIEVVTLAALAAQLILAAVSLINLKQIRMVWRVGLPARAAMLVTFVSTLLLPLEYSIYLGVGLSLLLYLYASSEDITAVQLVLLDNGNFREQPPPAQLSNHTITIISLHGSLYFAAARQLTNLLPDPSHSSGAVVILRLREAHGLGSTALNAITAYHAALQAHAGRLILTGVSHELRATLDRAGVLAVIGRENVFEKEDEVFAATRSAFALQQQHAGGDAP